MWGMGGWTGSDDAESLASLDRAIELGCNFFDTAFAYGDGHSETLLGEALRRHRRAAALRRHQGPAQEPPLAGAADDAPRRRLPLRPRGRHDRDERREPRRRAHRPAAAPRLERRVGGGRRLAARGGGPEATRPGRGLRHQRQPLGADERAEGDRDGPRRQRPGRLQRLRPGSGGRALPRVREGRHRRDRTRPLRRGQPRRLAAPRLQVAAGRLAEPLLHSGAPARDARARRRSCDRSCRPAASFPTWRLRFILHHPAVSTTIPGMRRAAHVEANLAAGDAPPLPQELVDALRGHRWERDWRVP